MKVLQQSSQILDNNLIETPRGDLKRMYILKHPPMWKNGNNLSNLTVLAIM